MNFKEDKLRSTFLEEINSFLSKRQDLKELAFITVTDVEIIDEGRSINVYFSYFASQPEPSQIEEITQYLTELIPEIRRIIKKRVKTKYVPNISFKYDNTPYKASRIEGILKKIEMERNDASSDKGDSSS